MKEWIGRECVYFESLDTIYCTYDKRIDAYHPITDILSLENTHYPNLWTVFYGHPVMFTSPTLYVVKEVLMENKQVLVLPVILSLEGLFTNLASGSKHGCCV